MCVCVCHGTSLMLGSNIMSKHCEHTHTNTNTHTQTNVQICTHTFVERNIGIYIGPGQTWF